jgi:hypothetical protein
MAQKTITLYTVENPRDYVKTRSSPPLGLKQNCWAFVELARYLGWNYWSWTFSEISDFKNQWMDLKEAAEKDLWVLTVPRQEIRWCALGDLCENRGAVRNWFLASPELIREKGGIPLGLIRIPIIPSWISKKIPAKQAFQEAGIWAGDGPT